MHTSAQPGRHQRTHLCTTSIKPGTARHQRVAASCVLLPLLPPLLPLAIAPPAAAVAAAAAAAAAGSTGCPHSPHVLRGSQSTPPATSESVWARCVCMRYNCKLGAAASRHVSRQRQPFARETYHAKTRRPHVSACMRNARPLSCHVDHTQGVRSRDARMCACVAASYTPRLWHAGALSVARGRAVDRHNKACKPAAAAAGVHSRGDEHHVAHGRQWGSARSGGGSARLQCEDSLQAGRGTKPGQTCAHQHPTSAARHAHHATPHSNRQGSPADGRRLLLLRLWRAVTAVAATTHATSNEHPDDSSLTS
jgi:hypothetical protein